MEVLYSFIIVVVLIGQFVLGKMLVVGEEDMNDTPKHKQYIVIVISLILLTPALLVIWLLDRSQPQPLIALLLAIPFFIVIT